MHGINVTTMLDDHMEKYFDSVPILFPLTASDGGHYNPLLVMRNRATEERGEEREREREIWQNRF